MNKRMLDFEIKLDQLTNSVQDEKGWYLWGGMFKVAVCLLAFGDRLYALPALELLKNGPEAGLAAAYRESMRELVQVFPMLQTAFDQGELALMPGLEVILPEVLDMVFAAPFDTDEWQEILLAMVEEAEGEVAEEMRMTHARSSEIKALAFTIFEGCGSGKSGGRTLYDGASGTETFYQKPPEDMRVYIQEEEEIWLALEAIRAFAAGIPADQVVFEHSDALAAPLLKGRQLQQYDWVYMEPKLGRDWSEVSKAVDFDAYGRFVYGKPPKKNADWLYASQLIASLKPDGIGAIVMSAGSLFATGTQKIRKKVIEDDVIEMVISLPKDFIYQSHSEASLVVFNRKKRRPGKILFVQADAFRSGPFVCEMREDNFNAIIEDFVEVLYEQDHDLESISRWMDNSRLKNDNLLASKYVIGRLYISEAFGSLMMRPEALECQPELPELGSLVSFYRGISPTGCVEDEDGEYAIIQMADVQDGELLTWQVAAYDITSRAKTEAYTVRAGDVIIVSRGRPKLALVPEDGDGMLISQSYIGMRPKDQVSGAYLKLYLESPLGGWLLSREQQGSSIQSLNARDLKEIPVILPDMNRQCELAEQYAAAKMAIEKEIQALELEKKKLQVALYGDMGIGETFELDPGWDRPWEEGEDADEWDLPEGEG